MITSKASKVTSFRGSSPVWPSRNSPGESLARFAMYILTAKGVTAWHDAVYHIMTDYIDYLYIYIYIYIYIN